MKCSCGNKLGALLKNHWFLAGIVLILFLLTNRYIYGWDDQVLEVPLLKHLIDPELFRGDYYVESLQANFTSYLYPLLARVISVDQVPAAYFFLYLASRYFLFFYSLKLWQHVSGKTWIAFAAVLMSFLIGRTEEFLYRTFSHQEFALAVIMAGFYYFYKERTIVAAVLFGIAANFNAIYALFPMMYCCAYLVLSRRFKQFLLSSSVFVLTALPFLAWTFRVKLHKAAAEPGLYDGWRDLFLLACPQNFLFQERPLTEVFSNFSTAMLALGPYLFLIALYIFNVIFNAPFRKSLQSHAVFGCACGLLVISFIFSYAIPSRFVIDLNLIRNMQYLNFILMGYTTVWICRKIEGNNLSQAFWAALLLGLLCFKDIFGVLVLVVVGVVTAVRDHEHPQEVPGWKAIAACLTDVLLAVAVFYVLYRYFDFSGSKFTYLAVCALGLSLVYLGQGVRLRFMRSACLNALYAVIPLVTMLAYFGVLHYNYVRITTKGGGFWQLQRNWEEMQRFVKLNTPKNALLMVPYNMEMCGFRIGSERKIIVSYRDCGIVGFDYRALKEWQRRIADIEHFKVFPDGPLQSAIINGLGKYKADYIVFTRLAAPKADNPVLTRLHANEVFVLFKVNR